MSANKHTDDISLLKESIRRLSAKPWRAVEAQHNVVTRKLVDSLDEQLVLEQMLEMNKPPYSQPGDDRLHYLLATPFRYPPLKYGSRYGTRAQRGMWYGSAKVNTALCEVAYYRFLFLDASMADLGTVYADFTVFRASVKTSRGIDLTREPYSKQKVALTHSTDYSLPQQIGANMREARVQAFRYFSARDKDNGINIAVINSLAFDQKNPLEFMHWHCVANSDQVEFVKQDIFKPVQLRFDRAYFD